MSTTEARASGGYRLYSVTGWGSALTEAMLEMSQATYDLVDVTGFEKPGPARDHLLQVNRLAQVPTLVLPEGVVLTESAAITLVLAERYPEAGIAPAVGDPMRPHFLRRLVWLVANVYPSWTYGDLPERWITAEPRQLRTSTDNFRNGLWTEFESDLPDGQWALGEGFSALDVYIAVMMQWRPGPAWFADHCPKLYGIGERAFELPAIETTMKRNFPDRPPRVGQAT